MKSTLLRNALLSLMAAATLQANSIFLQSPPSNSGNGLNIIDNRVADDFIVPANTMIGSISFWYYAQFQTDLSQVTWAFYDDNNGALGGVLGSGTTAPGTNVDGNAYIAQFVIPVLHLNGGKYWLELHAGSSLSDTSGFAVAWANVDDNATLQALLSASPQLPSTSVSTSGFEQLAFALGGSSSSAAPEPSTVWLLFGGVAALYLLRSRQNR